MTDPRFRYLYVLPKKFRANAQLTLSTDPRLLSHGLRLNRSFQLTTEILIHVEWLWYTTIISRLVAHHRQIAQSNRLSQGIISLADFRGQGRTVQKMWAKICRQQSFCNASTMLEQFTKSRQLHVEGYVVKKNYKIFFGFYNPKVKYVSGIPNSKYSFWKCSPCEGYNYLEKFYHL